LEEKATRFQNTICFVVQTRIVKVGGGIGTLLERSTSFQGYWTAKHYPVMKLLETG
jgi:hypothetical protein